VDDQGGAHHSVTTLSALEHLPESDTIYGQVFQAGGVAPAVGTIVYLTLMDGDGAGDRDQAMLMSALVDEDGYWQANLGNARLADGKGPFAYSQEGDKVSVRAHSATAGSVTQTIEVSEAQDGVQVTLGGGARLYLPLVIRQ
jgi:hypothetical protein